MPTTPPPMPDDPLDFYEWMLGELAGDEPSDEPDPGEECLTAAERNPSMLPGR